MVEMVRCSNKLEFGQNLKGGDPSAPSSTDTLLRLNPHRWIYLASTKCKSSGTPNFADLTGSVCKRRERIHRNLLICDYYQFQVHAGEFQPAIPTEECFRD